MDRRVVAAFASSRHPSRGRTASPILWGALMAVVSLTFVLPFAHWTFPLWVHSSSGHHVARALILSLLVTWFLGRPLAVLLSDRLRAATPPPQSRGVSVVIPCHNAASGIEETVRSLFKQTFRPIEIVLVENKSTDETWGVICELARRNPEVKALSVVPHPDEYAPSVAINHGVENATYDMILRLDDDTHLRNDAIGTVVAQMSATGAVAVACNLRLANAAESIWTRLQAMEYLFAMDMDRRSQALVQSILCCSGGMALFRREVILRAGGFVSEPREVSEDMDMTLKAHRYGRVNIAPEAIGFTKVPATFTPLARQRHRWAISGTVSLYLHRAGLANPSYWYEGLIGFIGLPMRAAVALRDLLAPLYILDIGLLLAHGGPIWLLVMVGGRMVIVALQMLILAPALNRQQSRQGLAYWWLIPFYVLVYGPLLLCVRFAGTWTGLYHVRELRMKHDRVYQRGLGAALLSPEVTADDPPVPTIATTTPATVTRIA